MLNKKLLGSVSSLPSDDNFENVTLLLNGDGTNGAQNNTFVDSSTNNFTITRNGNTTQGSFSPYGNLWSNYFKTTDKLTVGTNSAFNLNTYASFECWVNLSVLGTNDIFTGREANFWLGYNFAGLGGTANKFVFAIYNGSSWQGVSSTTSPVAGVWYHIVGVRDGSTLRMYVNGTQENTSTMSGSPENGGYDFFVNAQNDNETFTGYLSNIRYITGSSSTVLPYTSTFTPSTTPLTAVTGTVILTSQSNRFRDNSSNNFTLSTVGTPSVQRFSPFEPTAPYSTSVIGGSGYFDGSGDTLNTASDAAFGFGTGSWTLEAWVYPTTAQTDNWILATNDSGKLRMRVGASGYLSFYTDTGSISLNSTTVVTVNSWSHVAICYDGTNLSLFQNGVRTATTTASVDNGSANSLYVGSNTVGGSYWNGYISNARVVKGTAVYSGSTYTVPTAPVTAVSGTSLLTNFTNAGIPDLAMQNNLETVGNAQVSTSVKKFGTGSMSFNGTNSALTAPQNNVLGFGTGNFTVEFWMYPNSTPAGARTLIDFRNPTNNNDTKLSIWITSGNKFIVYSATTAKLNDVGSWSATQWAHIALCKSGSTTNLYVNGTSVGSFSDTTNYGATSFVTVASDNGQSGYWFNGYIDDLRITKGVARYTANFTAPASALPTY